jgi:hypothetical protein
MSCQFRDRIATICIVACRRFLNRKQHALRDPARPGGIEGCGAPRGTCAAISEETAKRLCERRFSAPRGVSTLAPSLPWVSVLLPNVADTSHITAGLDGLGA